MTLKGCQQSDADVHTEACGGTGGQRIYDQRPAVGFLGVRLRVTRKTGYERVEADCLEYNDKEEGDKTPRDLR